MHGAEYSRVGVVKQYWLSAIPELFLVLNVEIGCFDVVYFSSAMNGEMFSRLMSKMHFYFALKCS